jgi:hypothetical protein
LPVFNDVKCDLVCADSDKEQSICAWLPDAGGDTIKNEEHIHGMQEITCSTAFPAGLPDSSIRQENRP